MTSSSIVSSVAGWVCRRFATLARRFGRNQAGAAAVIAAILFPIIIGGLGLGVETGYWYLMQRKLQHAADVSAHAAAVRIGSGGSVASIMSTVAFIAGESGYPSDAPPPAVTTPYKSDASAVEVVLRQPVPRLFTSFFTDAPLVLSARAVARVDGATRPSCVLALSPDAAGAVTVAGSATVQLNGCDLVSNSNAASAIDLRGAVSVAGGCAYVMGGAQGTEHLTLTECDGVRRLSAPAPDPFAGLPTPDASRCNTVWEGLTVKCFNNGLSLTDAVLTDNTLYVVTGGEVSARDSLLTAQNVAFHLSGSARIGFEGNSQLQLSAPTNGAFNGVLFSGWQNAGITNSVRGTVDSVLNGAIHFPNADVEYSGNSSVGCTMVVAYRITFTGNTDVSCSASTSSESAGGPRTVSLVE